MKKMIIVSFMGMIGFFTNVYATDDNFVEYSTLDQGENQQVD